MWSEYIRANEASAFTSIALKEYEMYITFYNRLFDKVAASNFTDQEVTDEVYNKEFIKLEVLNQQLRTNSKSIVQQVLTSNFPLEKNMLVLLDLLLCIPDELDQLISNNNSGKFDFNKFKAERACEDFDSLLQNIKRRFSL
eukprot:TRINITY_DN1989_c0_g1_i3.p1 TRINITY_DN1989_c0_g1~~TRINITY_DN1989_c0_g1_i3.p1  ORF type:complete len:141 (+),score=29.62 TRINITY_DN1989_c0_g1_i3:458-880(+)